MCPESLAAVRAEALFVSDVRRSDPLTADLVRAAVRRSVRRYGCKGCSARVAEEFGDHPETAAPRMSWVLDALRTVYPASQVPPIPDPPTDPSSEPIAA
jgi:hypothetical protein